LNQNPAFWPPLLADFSSTARQGRCVVRLTRLFQITYRKTLRAAPKTIVVAGEIQLDLVGHLLQKTSSFKIDDNDSKSRIRIV
jgi:hypothetical protein